MDCGIARSEVKLKRAGFRVDQICRILGCLMTKLFVICDVIGKKNRQYRPSRSWSVTWYAMLRPKKRSGATSPNHLKGHCPFLLCPVRFFASKHGVFVARVWQVQRAYWVFNSGGATHPPVKSWHLIHCRICKKITSCFTHLKMAIRRLSRRILATSR